jgi:hypothetical protein
MTTESQLVQPPGKTQSGAERMRAYRRRRRSGLRCVKVRVGRADLDGLVDKMIYENREARKSSLKTRDEQ